MKFAELIETTRNGLPTYRLICPDQSLSKCFDEWAYQIARKRKVKSLKAYAFAVKKLLNYLNKVDVLHGGLTAILLKDALDAYESYLVYGAKSESVIARSVAKVLDCKSLSGSSIGVHFAGVNSFLVASEAAREGLIELQSGGYISEVPISPLPLTEGRSEDATTKVQYAIKSKSWFAGCVAGGARRVKRTRLSAVSKPSTLAYTDNAGGDDKAFPIDKCMELINSASCLRDAVLWSLLAASGGRISEALTLQLEDIIIDVDNPSGKKVLIIDPASRRNVLSKYVSERTLNNVTHKGRATTATYLIEPFASVFWVYLNEYMEEQRAQEKARHQPVFHRFLFRNLRNGKPIPASYQTVWARFNAAAIKVTGQSYGFHSLRHMYAYYLLNHCPSPANPKKFGLDLKVVQHLMGHKSIKSTERYARRDAKMLDATFAAINMLRMSASNYSVSTVQIMHLENEVEQLREELKKGREND